MKISVVLIVTEGRMDNKIYDLMARIEKCDWRTGDDKTIMGFLICLYTVERNSKHLKCSFDCKNLIRSMEMELRKRRRTMGVLDKEAA